MVGVSTAEIFKAMIESLPDDPLPEEPIRGRVGWDNITSERPCIDAIRFGRKIDSYRNETLYRIATEFRRRGWDLESSLKECYRVNDHIFNRQLKRSELTSTVKSAFKGDLAHGCEDHLLRKYCVGADKCPWVKEVFRSKDYNVNEHNESAFESNWLGLLRIPVVQTYYTLRSEEQKRGLPPGSLITISERELAVTMKLIDRGVARRALQNLSKNGLIEIVTKGVGGRRESSGFASIYRRIIPIPKPGGKNEK